MCAGWGCLRLCVGVTNPGDRVGRNRPQVIHQMADSRQQQQPGSTWKQLGFARNRKPFEIYMRCGRSSCWCSCCCSCCCCGCSRAMELSMRPPSVTESAAKRGDIAGGRTGKRWSFLSSSSAARFICLYTWSNFLSNYAQTKWPLTTATVVQGCTMLKWNTNKIIISSLYNLLDTYMNVNQDICWEKFGHI